MVHRNYVIALLLRDHSSVIVVIMFDVVADS